MERKTIVEHVVKIDQYEMEGDVSDLISLLSNIPYYVKAHYPYDKRDFSLYKVYKLAIERGYDDDWEHIIYGIREENDKEYNNRMKIIERAKVKKELSVERRKILKEKRDEKDYLRLKAKFESK